ncbi:nucleoside hydrolase [Massarina eburnea CBS 473.64]|uniref:Nucleoside hydrolase n=1 Tax=Massarina eburnea CBS 473.64 TaxID=1395130 RepID=A0A6A6RUC1_9PLEO|nr:nucleoside hydrolase [Massarina eburnea CBS 473.64]
MLLAFSAKAEELEVLLLSVTFGNVDVRSCLRNIVTMFQKIEQERKWRKDNGRPEGFEALMARKPIVAVGAEEPLAEQMMVADFFHGIDGLGGIHTTHPHLSPQESWQSLFLPQPPNLGAAEASSLRETQDAHSLFTPSVKPAHEEILRILREEEEGTVTIVAVGPLTNLAVAAARDPETFLRVKEVVVMGGAVGVPGNVSLTITFLFILSLFSSLFFLVIFMTPGAEFNTYADSIASARVYALTSPNPQTTMPPFIPGGKGQLGPYPASLSKRLQVKLFPLEKDITNLHTLPHPLYTTHTAPFLTRGSPLAEWTSLFLTSTFTKIASLEPPSDAPTALQLHDPLTIWYALSSSDPKWQFSPETDVRVETAGQWTRGTCIVDRRGREIREGTKDIGAEVVGDAGGWSDLRKGNRVRWCVGSPGTEEFAGVLLGRVFGGVVAV